MKPEKMIIKKIFNFFKFREKTLNRIQARIDSKESEKPDLDLISIFHKLKSESTNQEMVDDKTWNDLDMDLVFKKMDRSLTPMGSQYLYYILHKYQTGMTENKNRFDQYAGFASDKALKENILLTLFKIKNDNAVYIPNLIFKDLPQKPKFFYLVYLLSFSSLFLMVLSFLFPQFIFGMIFVFLINIALNLFYNKRISEYFIDISSLGEMIQTGIKLSKINATHVRQIEVLKQQTPFCRSLQNKLGWLTIDKTSLSDLSSIMINYFDYFCLFNLVSFIRSIDFINSNRSKIEVLFTTIGSLDAEIAISSYLQTLPFYCKPELNRENKIETTDIYHPLLKNPISNSFSINKKSCLITGSNMAGKTTFIKTLGVNIILAQTLSFVFGKSVHFPQSIVKTSIKRNDEIANNKSYYYAEIESILNLIELSNASHASYIFLIDEIFRGTNTIERISASVNVLNFISKHSLTFVTTHDIELRELLNNNFEMYHFNEKVEDGNHYFDYKIKQGPCLSRNAIRLLEIKGYPSRIISGSISLAEKLSNK